MYLYVFVYFFLARYSFHLYLCICICILQGFQDEMLNSARQLLELVEPVRKASKSRAEDIGHLVSTMAGYLPSLSNGSIGTASKTLNSKRQMAILDQTKTVAEVALQLTYAAREGGGNYKVHTNTHIYTHNEQLGHSLKHLQY